MRPFAYEIISLLSRRMVSPFIVEVGGGYLKFYKRCDLFFNCTLSVR